jgi:hypothetical protein
MQVVHGDDLGGAVLCVGAIDLGAGGVIGYLGDRVRGTAEAKAPRSVTAPKVLNIASPSLMPNLSRKAATPKQAMAPMANMATPRIMARFY